MTSSSSLSPESPLSSILNDIERALAAKLYYPALLVSLTIPEICSALALDKTVFVKETHYAAFVDKYTSEGGPGGLGLNGIDCYRLRGGVVHRANMAGHPKFEATHVIFTIPESRASIHALSLAAGGKTAAMLDLKMFCHAMINAAHDWYEDHKGDPKVTENMDNLIRYCPDGLSPFLGGAPIIASGA